jgi:hypothetical protein
MEGEVLLRSVRSWGGENLCPPDRRGRLNVDDDRIVSIR